MAFCNLIEEASLENRHEILLEGEVLDSILKQDDNSLPNSLFELKQLNYLRLSSSSLSVISSNISNLINMTNLVLQNNKLSALPDEIGSLSKLKLLDLSNNKLEYLPEGLNQLSQLQTVNLRNNSLTNLVSFENCVALAHLDFKHNNITSLDKICHNKLVMLSELDAGNNKIEEIPTEISCLTNLKIFSATDNSIKEVQGDILQCIKIKEICLKGNPLSDRRLRKLVESDRGYSKTILDYMKQHCSGAKGKGSASNKDKKKKNKKEKIEEEIDSLCDRLSVLTANKDSTLTVQVSADVKDIRSHIICCVMKNLDLTGPKLKRFLSVQTKLHDTICEKRVAATIATHDLSKIQGPLKLCAKRPDSIKILPLNRKKLVSAQVFFKALQEEAETVRKQMKRNTYSGIHKFLYLVEGWERWPCLIDSKDVVISFPPITNAENTKIECESSNIFVEVTSSVSINKAKEVMEALILATIEAELTTDVTETNKKHLQIEQVRILNEDDNLKMVYPSRTDLQLDENTRISVVRL